MAFQDAVERRRGEQEKEDEQSLSTHVAELPMGQLADRVILFDPLRVEACGVVGSTSEDSPTYAFTYLDEVISQFWEAPYDTPSLRVRVSLTTAGERGGHGRRQLR